jgi:hypothetical protein
MKSKNNNNDNDDDDDGDDDNDNNNNNNTAMGSVHARGDTFLTFGLKALTETNTSRLATGLWELQDGREITGRHGDKYENSCLVGLGGEVWWVLTDVSEVLTAYIIRVLRNESSRQ